MVQIKEHSQKLTPYLLKNDVVFFFESYWKRENVADINFLDFNKLNDWASQWKKSDILRLILRLSNILAIFYGLKK